MKTADSLFEKMKNLNFGENSQTLRERCEEYAPLVDEINALKKEKDAVILAHTYVPPQIIYGVADHVGDSYGLSKKALEAPQNTIIFSAVRFMGETAKILNPEKNVIVPAKDGGCTLADSITPADIDELKSRYPGYAVSCYINTTAEVKAQCDFCVTSSNVFDIFQHYPSHKIIFLPDRLMGQNIIDEMARRGVKKDIVLSSGSCYIHEEYTPEEILAEKKRCPGLQVLTHPECSPETIALSDFVGSTTQIYDEMKKRGPGEYMILSERGLTARIEAEISGDHRIVGPPKECKYMRTNSLDEILRVLKNPRPQDFLSVDEEIRQKADRSIRKMFEIVGQYCS